MAQEAYALNIYGPNQFGDISVIVLQASFASAGPTITRDATQSSPDTTIVRDGTGQFTVTFPKSVFVHFVSAARSIAEAAAGQFIDLETLQSGSATFETSTTKGTAADPADGEKLFFTFLIGAP